ncbi:MAG: flagellar protein FlaG [Krumholzibacteria bacterium]|nr:flagellar protein FlaG [Candidatus Krumholzibacteria bacterium]
MAEIKTLQGIAALPPAAAGARAAREPAPRPAPEPPAPAPPAQSAWSREELEAALDRLRESLARVRPEPYRVSFRTDEETNRTVILIKDAAGEVVKQFPPEKILNLHHKMDDLVGMIVDEAT